MTRFVEQLGVGVADTVRIDGGLRAHAHPLRPGVASHADGEFDRDKRKPRRKMELRADSVRRVDHEQQAAQRRGGLARDQGYSEAASTLVAGPRAPNDPSTKRHSSASPYQNDWTSPEERLRLGSG